MSAVSNDSAAYVFSISNVNTEFTDKLAGAIVEDVEAENRASEIIMTQQEAK